MEPFMEKRISLEAKGVWGMLKSGCPVQELPFHCREDQEQIEKAFEELVTRGYVTVSEGEVIVMAKKEEGSLIDLDEVEAYREVIRDHISYAELIKEYDQERIDEVVELVLEVLCSLQKEIRIGQNFYPAGLVKHRLLRLTKDHVEYVFTCMEKNPVKIRNIKCYLLASLYNAPATIGNYYRAEAYHDLYG